MSVTDIGNPPVFDLSGTGFASEEDGKIEPYVKSNTKDLTGLGDFNAEKPSPDRVSHVSL